MTWMTLFIDASHCPQTKHVGYGAWAKRDGWKSGHFFGGRLAPCGNSREAELAAIAAALEAMRKKGHLFGLRSVMVQSDSLRALELIVAKNGSTISNHPNGCPIELRHNLTASPSEKASLQAIKEAAGDVSIWARHVRGHKADGTRSVVNNRCDKLARRHMREARGQ